jgi:hypothetical protein
MKRVNILMILDFFLVWEHLEKLMLFFSSFKPFRNQDYYQIKPNVRGLFEDPLFPANNHSIGLNYLRAHKHKFPYENILRHEFIISK